MQLDFDLLILAYRPCFLASSFLCSIVSIAVHFLSCQLPSCNLFTSHSSLIVFWERDITSEHHGTPVHILIIVYTLISFSVFSFSCYHYHYPLCFLSFVNNKIGEIDNLSKLRWEQSYLCCVQVRVRCAVDTYLSLPESYERQTLSST